MKKTLKNKSGNTRPPIVTVLGHVDHGKTTLLDSIRKTNFVKKEAGGITQSIGASVVTTKESKDITFIDTPGHAAFSKMRSRGAKVADIALLVVATDDGVKPQTKEALRFIKDAKIPFIVVITKIDLSSNSSENVKGQLEKVGVIFEGRGGDTPLVSLSAKTGKGLEELLETITLVAEVEEIKADKKAPLEAVVIETGKGKAGPVASVVVRNGTLMVGDQIVVEDVSCKVRALLDDKGVRTKIVLPGYPSIILGFDNLPDVGSVVGSLGKGKKVIGKKYLSKAGFSTKEDKDKIAVLIKAKNTGLIEAVAQNLPEGVLIVDSSVGAVTESDVFMAKTSDATIMIVDAKVPKPVSNLANTESVQIKQFDVIYKLFEELEEMVKKDKIEIIGKAEVLEIFPYDGKKVAGCRVLEGQIRKSRKLRVTRGEKELGDVKITTMRRAKENIDIAKKGEEFGVIFKPQLDFEKGDMILSVTK